MLICLITGLLLGGASLWMRRLGRTYDAGLLAPGAICLIVIALLLLTNGYTST